MLDKQMQAEARLGTALGWTNLVYVGETILGTPPCGGANSRGQAALPRWSRDWSACGPLLGHYDLAIAVDGIDSDFVVLRIASVRNEFVEVAIKDMPEKDAAVRYAITLAATVRLTRTDLSIELTDQVGAF